MGFWGFGVLGFWGIGGTITDRETGLLRIGNDLLHVTVPQRAKQTEEETTFRQPPRQLFL